MTIKDIENAVINLPRRKLAAFRDWFYKFDAKTWDEDFEEGVKSGKLDNMANQAIEDFRNNRCKEL